jgi:hypothetical protein
MFNPHTGIHTSTHFRGDLAVCIMIAALVAGISYTLVPSGSLELCSNQSSKDLAFVNHPLFFILSIPYQPLFSWSPPQILISISFIASLQDPLWNQNPTWAIRCPCIFAVRPLNGHQIPPRRLCEIRHTSLVGSRHDLGLLAPFTLRARPTLPSLQFSLCDLACINLEEASPSDLHGFRWFGVFDLYFAAVYGTPIASYGIRSVL